jgi:hypothetical protein
MFRAAKAILNRVTNKGSYLIIHIPDEDLREVFDRFALDGILSCEIRIDDNRHISSEQRKKAYATLGDIADSLGYAPEQLKETMKYKYIGDTGDEYFSLGDCSMDTARKFISNILDFAVEWGIALRDTLLNRTDDINAAIYSSLKHKKCVLCGKPGDIHHVEAIGAGRNRKKYDDSAHEKICLCREHHSEAHTMGWQTFSEKHHIYGIVVRAGD